MAEELAQERRLRIWNAMTPEQRDYDRFVAGVIPQGASWRAETPWGIEHGRANLDRMIGYEEECCSCHVNPPCSYCTSRLDCEVCGEFVHEDEMAGHVSDKHATAVS